MAGTLRPRFRGDKLCPPYALIGAILQKVSGKSVDILAQENIFAPPEAEVGSRKQSSGHLLLLLMKLAMVSTAAASIPK
jgi:hypothetical protein